MNKIMSDFLSILFTLIVLVSLSSCSLIQKEKIKKTYAWMTPEQEILAREESRNIISNIEDINKDIKTFKGIGKLKLWNQKSEPIHERFAWIASKPSSIGIVILVSGQPVLRFSTDGTHIYFIDFNNPQKSFRKIRTRDARLDKIVSIPIRAEDIVTLLSGQVPFRTYSDSILIPELNNNGFIIILENKRKKTIEKIFIDEKKKVKSIEMYNPNGSLLYRAKLEAIKPFENFLVPSKLIITSENGDGILITVHRFIANTQVSPSAFVITPPDNP